MVKGSQGRRGVNESKAGQAEGKSKGGQGKKSCRGQRRAFEEKASINVETERNPSQLQYTFGKDRVKFQRIWW